MKRTDVGDRIIVLGCSGSGKSTFSRKLRDLTGLPLYPLDQIWWNADRTHIARDEFDCRLRDVMRTERWILDGDYSRTYEMRFAACDTVIFLDYPTEVCMDGIVGRVGTVREDIPWTENRLDPELVKLVQDYREQNRPVVYELMKRYPKERTFVFSSRQEANHWLRDGAR